MDARERFMARLEEQALVPADVIFLAAGDGVNRVPHAARLHAEGHAPRIIIVSGDRRYEYGSMPASELAEELVKAGVPQDALVLEETAMNTKDEAERALALMRREGWRSVLIVTSPHHQYRAFLTWLAAMRRTGDAFLLVNAPASLTFAEHQLLQEFERIEKYRAQGDVASYEEGVEYLDHGVSI